LADLDTPLSVFLALDRDRKRSFLLESVEGGEVWGRYSILACDVEEMLVFERGKGATLVRGRERGAADGADPLGALAGVLAKRAFVTKGDAAKVAPPPPFRGGAVGWMGYDAVTHYAKLAPLHEEGSV